jgi:hypothetical protein
VEVIHQGMTQVRLPPSSDFVEYARVFCISVVRLMVLPPSNRCTGCGEGVRGSLVGG